MSSEYERKLLDMVNKSLKLLEEHPNLENEYNRIFELFKPFKPSSKDKNNQQKEILKHQSHKKELFEKLREVYKNEKCLENLTYNRLGKEYLRYNINKALNENPNGKMTTATMEKIEKMSRQQLTGNNLEKAENAIDNYRNNNELIERTKTGYPDHRNEAKIHLKKDEKTAEMVGIVLGDGHLKYDYQKYICKISLNNIDERQYVDYVKDLMTSKFKFEPHEYTRDTEKTIELDASRKEVVKSLISKGLTTGNKVKNQVGVPDWIKKSPEWINNNQEIWNEKYRPRVIGCLRGLFDTDGSVSASYRENRNHASMNIKFTNGSERLVKDFKEMCESLDIKMPKIYQYDGETKEGYKYTTYNIQTESKESVKNFIETVKPVKWEVKKEEIKNKLEKHDKTIEEVLQYQRSRKRSN